jgi:hypothetical protein
MGSIGWSRFCGQLSGMFVVPKGRCELGYTTYSQPMVEKRPVDRIIPFPTGRVLCVAHSRQSRGRGMPGYDHSVPPGQRLSTPVHEFDARLLQTERRRFEDEDDDDEDEITANG